MTSRTSAFRTDNRLDSYNPNIQKMVCQASRKPANSAKFLTLTRIDRRSARENPGVPYRTSTLANPKDQTMTAKSQSLAALIRIWRPKAVIGERPVF
jgi:hypothetical protein